MTLADKILSSGFLIFDEGGVSSRPPTRDDAEQDVAVAKERARRSAEVGGRAFYTGLDPDRLWRAYKQVWAMAEEICPVYLVRNIENNYAGAYFGYPDPSKRQIHVRRKALLETEAKFFDHPTWVNSPNVLVSELCTIAHEVAHAEHHVIGSARNKDYRESLLKWMKNGTQKNAFPRPSFTDWDKGRIYEEESLAEVRAREIVSAVLPEIRQECDARIYENLNNYVHILWEGHYSNGKPYVWTQDRCTNVVLDKDK